MGLILVTLIVGILLGIFIVPRKFEKINNKIQVLGISITLFAMGASLGGDPNMINNLKQVGIGAVTVSVAAIIGSVLMVYWITQKWFKENKHD